LNALQGCSGNHGLDYASALRALRMAHRGFGSVSFAFLSRFFPRKSLTCTYPLNIIMQERGGACALHPGYPRSQSMIALARLTIAATSLTTAARSRIKFLRSLRRFLFMWYDRADETRVNRRDNQPRLPGVSETMLAMKRWLFFCPCFVL